MKKYLLIIASIFLADCGSDSIYYAWNSTDANVEAEVDGNTVTIKAKQCHEVKKGDFPVKVRDKSAENVGHYTWNGTDWDKVEGNDDIEAHKKICKDRQSTEGPNPEDSTTTEKPTETPPETPEKTPEKSIKITASYVYLFFASTFLDDCLKHYGYDHANNFTASNGKWNCKDKNGTTCGHFVPRAWMRHYRDNGYECMISIDTVRNPPEGHACKSRLGVRHYTCTKVETQ